MRSASMRPAFQKAMIEVQAGGALSAAHVLGLRRAVYEDGRLDADEARGLLHLHRAGAGTDAPEDWADFFVEAMADFFALQREVPDWGQRYAPDFGRAARRALGAFSPFRRSAEVPRYAWSDVKAPLHDSETEALLEAFQAEGGLVLDAVEQRVLARLFDRAVDHPDALKAFALEAVFETVRADRRIEAGEVELVRRVLYGPGGDEGIAISTAEAEFIFALRDAAHGGETCPAWRELFKKAITMHVLFGGGSPDAVDGAEAEWLLARLGPAYVWDADAKALVDYIRQEARYLDPRLAAAA